MVRNDINFIDFINKYRRSSCTRNDSACCCPNICRSCGCAGTPGADGKSAYQIALDNGFVGTELQWLESLKGEPGPFLSSYIEAVGTGQTINNNGYFVFDTDPDITDTVGSDIEIDSTGTIFTINRAGLYRVEWSMNVQSASNPVLVGLIEDDLPTSALSNNALTGNYSSGALISVGSSEIPSRISLQNFGAPITIANPTIALNTAVSMRISRFADAPNA